MPVFMVKEVLELQLVGPFLHSFDLNDFSCLSGEDGSDCEQNYNVWGNNRQNCFRCQQWSVFFFFVGLMLQAHTVGGKE